MWVILQNNADWDCFKTPILQEISRIQNPLRVEHCAFLEVIHLFRSVGCVRNKLQFRTVQQCLRMDGVPALDLWDLIVTVLHGNTNRSEQVQGDQSTSLTRRKIPGKIDHLNNVDFIPSNVQGSFVECV